MFRVIKFSALSVMKNSDHFYCAYEHIEFPVTFLQNHFLPSSFVELELCNEWSQH